MNENTTNTNTLNNLNEGENNMNNESNNTNTINTINEGESNMQQETQQVVCAYCGELVDIELATEATDTGSYFCPDCEHHLYTCDDCGDRIETNHGDENHTLCEECREDYTECDHCGELINDGNLSVVRNYHNNWRGVEECWCESCRDDASYCEWCETWVYGMGVHEATNGSWVCESCAEDDFSWCSECGALVHNDDACWDEDSEEYFCTSCYENRRSRSVKNYGYKPSPQFLGEDSKLYLGVELEVGGASYSGSKDAADTLYDMGGNDSLFTMKEDSSIPTAGFEIVTQPCTYKFHKEEFPWESITGTCRSNGLRGHDLGSDSCGMHIHCSRNYMSELRWAMFEFFLTKTQKQWIKIARRNPSHWGRFKDIDLRGRGNFGHRSQTGRYQAVNFYNHYTVEIRIFRSTMKVSTIKATIGAVDAAVNFIKGLKTEELKSKSLWEAYCSYVKENGYAEVVEHLTMLGIFE